MEQNLGEYGQTYNNGLLIAALIFLGLFVTRLVFLKKEMPTRTWLWQGKAPIFVWILKLGWLFAMVFFLFDVPSWFLSVASFKPLVNSTVYGFFLVVLILLAIMELILSFTVTKSLIENFVKRILFLLLVVFCFFAFGLAALILPGTFQYPSEENCTLLEMPVKGKWLAMHSGQYPWVNYHSNLNAQKFAIDMVKVNEAKQFFTNNGAKLEDFFTLGDSVFAPASGIVIARADSFPNQKAYTGSDTINIAGNYVEIALPSNKFLFLAHLFPGTVAVQVGDTINAGQFIGLAGNSGNTTFPHLHLHIQDKPTINDSLSMGQPFRFKNIIRERFGLSGKAGNAYLNRNDYFYLAP